MWKKEVAGGEKKKRHTDEGNEGESQRKVRALLVKDPVAERGGELKERPFWSR